MLIQETVEYVLGRRVKLAIEILLLVYFFGVCLVFLVVIADVSIPVFEILSGGPRWYTSRPFITAVGTVIVTPLALLRTMRYLSPFSLIGLLSITYTVGLVVYLGGSQIAAEGLPDLYLSFPSPVRWLISFPIIAFAFQCHVSAVAIFREVESPTPFRQNIIIFMALGFCVFLYTICGFFGYVLFSAPKGDLIKVHRYFFM